MVSTRDWSVTASANTGNSVDGYFKENMNYSEVNDAAREMQAIIARDLQDQNGTIVSTGSTSSYNLSINASLSGYQDGDLFAFQAHAKNNGATTLKVSTLSSLSVVATDLSALVEDSIAAGGVYFARYKSASASSRQFQLLNPSRRIITSAEISVGSSTIESAEPPTLSAAPAH